MWNVVNAIFDFSTQTPKSVDKKKGKAFVTYISKIMLLNIRDISLVLIQK